MTCTTPPYDAIRAIEVLRRLRIPPVLPEGATLEDAATRESIGEYQRRHDIKVTRRLDGRTTNALHRVMMEELGGNSIDTIAEPEPHSADEVRRLQALLERQIEPKIELTGQMDEQTREAIRAYQGSKGTGKLNAATLAHLNLDLAARSAPPLDLDLEEVDDLFAEEAARRQQVHIAATPSKDLPFGDPTTLGRSDLSLVVEA